MSTDTDRVALSRSRAQAMYARDLACQTAGIRLDDVTPGRASLRMRVTETMVNGHGMAHGGYLFLLADAAFAHACNSHGPLTVAHRAQVTCRQAGSVDDELRPESGGRELCGPNRHCACTSRRGP